MKKTSIHLLVSDGMTERGENELIRFSYRVRSSLELDRGSLRLGREGFEIDVIVRSALLDDVKVLSVMTKSGKISAEDAAVAGFVSRDLYARLAGGRNAKRPTVWLSECRESIMVGADPEFGLVGSDGIAIPADQVMPGSKDKKFGADGPGAEVRPDPSHNHLDVVASIDKILRKPPEAAKNYKWVGGATYRDRNRTYWFGGHVHIGRPQSLDVQQAPAAFQTLARVLDHHMALPFLTFDTPEPFLRRDGCPKLRYGRAGDIREKPEGLYERFEYRTLSGVWLTHPTLAKIAIGATKAVAEDFYRRSEKVGHSPAFFARDHCAAYGLENLTGVTDLINAAQPKGLGTTLFAYWKKLMENLSTREEYAEEIGALIKLTEHSPDTVTPQLNMNIRENWQEGRPLLLEPPKDLETAIRAVEEKK